MKRWKSFIATSQRKAAAAEDLLPQLVAQGLRPDVIVLDPPRKGCEEAVLRAIAEAAPRRQPRRVSARTGYSSPAASAKASRKGAPQGRTKRTLSQTTPTATPMYSKKEKQRSARCCIVLTPVSVFAGKRRFYTVSRAAFSV